MVGKTKNEENVPGLEVIEAISFQFNLVDNLNQQNYEVLNIFTPNKSNSYLLNVKPRNLVFWQPMTLNLMKFHSI